MRIEISTVIAVFVAAALSGPPAAPAKPCTAPEYRRLDFWLGDWDVFEAGEPRRSIARARIESALGGCAVRERYEQADGLVGESLTSYDAARGLWHQTWVTNRGELLQIDGRFASGSLTLDGTRAAAGGGREIVRGVWRAVGAAVAETATRSTDGGRTWKPLFDIVFRRPEEAPAMPVTRRLSSDAALTLKRLNQEYVDAFLKSDVAWYRENLADDFVCIESDGTVLDRARFLENAGRATDVSTYELRDVRVRIFGDVALVHATGDWARRDGTKGVSRYTDVYAREGDRWKAVSAQITRTRS
jgi:ketosteroid isomerase-like protein